MMELNKIKILGVIARNFVLGFGIFILTIFVSVYGINTFYEKPEYDDFCNQERFSKPILEISGNETKICPAVCVPMYEIKGVQCIVEPCEPVCEFKECGSGCGSDGITTFDTLDKCEIVLSGKNCYDEYDNAMKKYSKNVFLIAIPLGVLIIALGAFIFNINAVGVGMMLGGVGTLIYGAGRYWRYSDNLLKFVISLIALAALIWLAYWFNKRAEKKKSKGKR